MQPKSTGIALLAFGVVLFLVALSADLLGIGAHPGIGLKQLAGAAVGVVLAVAGLRRLR